MIPRILEPEVMDGPSEALAYDTMDHSEVNRAFVDDWTKAVGKSPSLGARILDVGCGTGQIPILFAQKFHELMVTGVDLAQSMIQLGREHLRRLGLGRRVELVLVDAKSMPYVDGAFYSVVSNSIIHHIPRPMDCMSEMVRVCKKGGYLFVRDLLRPDQAADVDRLVGLYAAEANDHQRALFAASFHASLTLQEVRDMVGRLGFPPETVTQTTDRHWTWVARKAS